MSESIHAGYLPLWNPYINFGIPQYGDMSGGYWSPVTWLIASTVGYNAYTLTIEVLFYIVVGGLGVYQLTSLWIDDRRVKLIAGIAFMCCGYNVGHLQHFNWISGAAFLPWCFYSYLKLFENFSVKNTIIAALLFYMLLSSAHPGIIIGSFYFFLGLMVYQFFNKTAISEIRNRILPFGIAHAALAALLLCLSAGMIIGYLDILPHFVRGEKISIDASLSNPTNAQSWISVLLPFATVKNDSFYNTDPTMRNCYFSITLLVFFITSLFTKKNNLQKFLIVSGILFSLLSAGGIFKIFAYKFLPMIGYVRLNGEFRIFALLCFILTGAIALDNFIKEKKQFDKAIKWIYYTLEIIVILLIVFGFYNAFHAKKSFIYSLKDSLSESGFSLKIKSLIDSISFYDTLWIQGLIQLLILWGIKWCLKSRDFNLLVKMVVIEMILASLLNIPFTGVGKASVAEVQTVLNQSPKGIPLPPLTDNFTINSITAEQEKLVGDWNWYNKQIVVKTESSYPVALKNMRTYFEVIQDNDSSHFQKEPLLFPPQLTGTAINIRSFSPNKITVTVNATGEGLLVLKENYYPHWFYYQQSQKEKVKPFDINFMSMPVTKGRQDIVISFEPGLVKLGMIFSLIIFLGCCVLLIVNPTRLSLSSQRK